LSEEGEVVASLPQVSEPGFAFAVRERLSPALKSLPVSVQTCEPETVNESSEEESELFCPNEGMFRRSSTKIGGEIQRMELGTAPSGRSWKCTHYAKKQFALGIDQGEL